MTDSTLTFRVDDELKTEFAQACKVQDRSSAQVLRDYMREVVRNRQQREEYEAWERALVQEGLADVRAGRVVPHEQVEAHFAARREQLRQRIKAA